MDMGEFEVPGISAGAARDAFSAARAASEARRIARRASRGKGDRPLSPRGSDGGDAPRAEGGAAATVAASGGERDAGKAAQGDARERRASDGKGAAGDARVSDADSGGVGASARHSAAGGGDQAPPRRRSGSGDKERERNGSAAAAADKQDAAADKQRLRVYSVLPPCLAERARFWGGHLALKEGWQQTDRGFFDAPGANVRRGRRQPARGRRRRGAGLELVPR